MGASNPKIEGHKIKFIGQFESEYLGRVKIYRTDRERQAVGVKNNKFKVDLMQHSSLSHPNLLNLLTFQSESTEILGIYQENMYLYFDFVETSLSEIINMRKQRNQFFSEDEILRFLKDILSILAYLEQTRSVAHYGISPKSVFYDKKSKKMMLYDNECIHGPISCYYKYKNNQYTLVSPELIPAIQSMQKNYHDPDYKIDKQQEAKLTEVRSKIDIYMLGLTLLELCTYKDSQQLFDKENLKMIDFVIEQRIRQAGTQYYKNPTIEKILRQMLEKDHNQRPTAFQLMLTFERKPRNNPQFDLQKQQQTRQMVQGPKQQQVINAYFGPTNTFSNRPRSQSIQPPYFSTRNSSLNNSQRLLRVNPRMTNQASPAVGVFRNPSLSAGKLSMAYQSFRK